MQNDNIKLEILAKAYAAFDAADYAVRVADSIIHMVQHSQLVIPTIRVSPYLVVDAKSDQKTKPSVRSDALSACRNNLSTRSHFSRAVSAQFTKSPK